MPDIKDATRIGSHATTAIALLALAACVNHGDAPRAAAARSTTSIDEIRNVVVLYAENRSFDALYGRFPGAHGLDEVVDADGKPTAAYAPQKDRDGRTVLPVLPPTWGGVTADGVAPVVTQAESASLPNAPFALETTFESRSASHARLTLDTTTRNLWHRFFEHQMQIGDGRNDGFAAWSNEGGLTMGQFDTQPSRLYAIARRYVLADAFFQGAFGGSFLNHQYLICACAPEYPHADTAAAKPMLTTLDRDAAGRYLPRLATAPKSPRSALDGEPTFVESGNITPANYFGDGKFYAVNTMQPAYQPSTNAPVSASARDLPYADPRKASTLPPQTAATIGDRLDAKGIEWAWYGQSWKAALADGMQPASMQRRVIDVPNVARGSPNFQTAHQPFNYYAAFDPATRADARARHLKDEDDFVAAAAAGTLPAVAFYKPQGNLNQHPGYANIADGDAHLADLIATLQASPQWDHMLIVVTYDEFGGNWDHVAVPKGDLLGPGTRIPAIVVSPLARQGVVDHTPYDSGSIIRFITRRWNLEPLPGIVARDRALQAHGNPPMGDLTAALR